MTSTSEAPDLADDLFDRRLTCAASVAALFLFVPLLVPLLAGRIFVLDDLSSFHLPLRYLYQSALTSGHSVLWSSHLFSGFYVHAEGQVGALHPVHVLLYAALPLTVAFNLELALSYVFGFAGMWRFLRHVGFTSPSSIVGGMAFGFSGFALLHLPHMNAIAVIAHVPWLLWAMDLSISEPAGARRKGLVSVALLVGSQALLGYPQYLWMSALICLLYGVVCGRALVLRLSLAGVASVAGLMLGGIQIVPTFDLLANSVRANVATDFALSHSLHPLNILQLFSPYLLLNRVYAAPHERFIHEFGVYDGALTTIAFTWAVLRRKQLPFARLAVFAAATSIAGLLLALGRYGVLYEWVAMMPLVGTFRAPTRHIMLLHFGLAVLVAILFEDIRRLCAARSRITRQQKWLWAPVGISACVAAIAWWWPQLWATFPDQPLYGGGMMIGTALSGAATLLVFDAVKGSRAALMLLPCVLALDLGLWGYSYVFAGGIHTIDEVARWADPPAAEPGSTVHQAARNSKRNNLLLHDLKVLRPYVGLRPSRVLTLSSDDEFRVSGAQWVSVATGWRRVADPMPRVRFVPYWRLADNPAALTGIDIRSTALVTDDVRATAGTEATATLVRDEPGRMLVKVSAPGPALLVTTEAFDRGWRATGPSATGTLQTLRVYGDYLGVVAAPGDYELLLAFQPESMRWGWSASLLGLILTAIVAALASWKGQSSIPHPANVTPV